MWKVGQMDIASSLEGLCCLSEVFPPPLRSQETRPLQPTCVQTSVSKRCQGETGYHGQKNVSRFLQLARDLSHLIILLILQAETNNVSVLFEYSS